MMIIKTKVILWVFPLIVAPPTTGSPALTFLRAPSEAPFYLNMCWLLYWFTVLMTVHT